MTTLIKTWEEMLQKIKVDHGLDFVGEYTDRVNHKLYLFCRPKDQTPLKFFLKELQKSNVELIFYRDYLPKIQSKYRFATWRLPEPIDTYKVNGNIYLLLPDYGKSEDFNTSSFVIANQMVTIVKDLITVNVEEICPGGSNYDYQTFEQTFWKYFKRAVELGLIQDNEREYYQKIAQEILTKGRKNQKLVISNGDFNPRNIITGTNGQVVLIDWDGIVSPLEHMLAYPWLLNFQNPQWQTVYAQRFENELPVKKSNIRYHTMTNALIRAVEEQKNASSGNLFSLAMAKSLMARFRQTMTGLDSLQNP